MRSSLLLLTLLHTVARNNLRVKLGDLCNVHACLDIKYGKRVHILPFDDSVEGEFFFFLARWSTPILYSSPTLLAG